MTYLPQIILNLENRAIGYAPSGEGFNSFISNLIGLATTMAGIAMLGYFIYGAITWVVAGGNEDQIDKAQRTISNAVIGLVFVILATSIAAIIGVLTGVEILSPPWESFGPPPTTPPAAT